MGGLVFQYGVRGAFSGTPIASFAFYSDAKLFGTTIDPHFGAEAASFEIYGLTPEAREELSA